MSSSWHQACVFLSVAVWGLHGSESAGKSCDDSSEAGAVTLSFGSGEADVCRAAAGQSAARPHRSHNHRCVFLSVISERSLFCHPDHPCCHCFFFCHPRGHVWSHVTVSAARDHPENRPHCAGSSHAHLWWVCIHLAILPGDVWWYHWHWIYGHISERY